MEARTGEEEEDVVGPANATAKVQKRATRATTRDQGASNQQQGAVRPVVHSPPPGLRVADAQSAVAASSQASVAAPQSPPVPSNPGAACA